MARVPQFARPGAWQKPPARIEGERILKARAMEQRVMEQKAKVEAEARRVEEMESQKLDEKVDDLREQIDRLTDNIPKIIPAGGGGKRMVAKVLARDYDFPPGPLGDMRKSVYDPTAVGGDAFDMDNMVEGTDTKVMTAAERAIVADAVTKAGVETVAGAKTFSTNSAAATPVRIETVNDTATGGPQLDIARISASPAASDILGITRFIGSDSALAERAYANMSSTILDPTAGAYAGSLILRAAVAGTTTPQLTLADGVVAGAATGGHKGTGTLNATDFYRNGVALPFFGAIIDAKARFGVTGDGVTNDSAAVLAALTYMAANGGNIIFPENCLLSSLVTISSTSKGFNILGGSFIVNNSTGGIKISPSSIDHRIYWAAHIYAGIATSGRPLEIIFPVPTSHRGHSVILDHCEFRPLVPDNSSYRFTNGVRVENAWHGRANKCVFNGAESNNFSCPIGLELAGKSINFDVISCYGTNVSKGYSCGVDCEGFRAIFTNAIAVQYGFNFDATGAADPQAVLMGCHTNATTRAVVAINRNSVTIQGCMFYRFGTVAGYKDIEIVGGTGHVITGNSAYLGGSVENWFVHATDVDGMIVRDNYLTGRWHHVQLEGTSRNVSVSNNRQLTLVAASYADELVNNSSGSDNKILHWKAESYSTTTLNASGTTNNIATATATAITWSTTPNYNEMGGFASGSPTRISPPAWVKTVELACAVEFASNSTGYRLVTIRKNGSTVMTKAACAPANGTATNVNVAPIRVAHTAGDYYEVFVSQNSGGDLSVASTNTRFECRPVS